MDNKIECVAWSGDMRVLIQISPCPGWKVSPDVKDIKIPVLTISPAAAKHFMRELKRLTEFYRSDYYLWSQRKIGKIK